MDELTLLDGDLFNLTSYIEASVGAGYRIEPLGLTVGARAKLLYGVVNAQTDNTRLALRTDNGYDKVQAELYYQIQEASVAQWDTATNRPKLDLGSLLDIGNANTGLALDLGAKYDLGPFSFSAAILDISPGIHWKHNVNTIVPEGGQGVIRFDGLDVSTLLDGGTLSADSLVDQWTESLNGMTPRFAYDSGDYWYPIPAKINLGASYSFGKIFRAGLLLHGQLDRGFFPRNKTEIADLTIPNTFRFNTTLSVGANIFNWAEVIVGSSIVYDGSKVGVLNPGLGLVLTPATIVQIYTMVDYVGSIYLADSKAFNMKFGLNWLIGKGGRHKIVAD